MIKKLIALVALIAVLGVAAVAYAYLKPPEVSSGPLEAIPVVVATPAAGDTTVIQVSPATIAPTPTAQTAANQAAATATTQPATATAIPATATPEAATPQPAANAPTVFQIDQSVSQASFTIDEVLNGSPKTVVGTTNQVAGQIAVDPNNPAAITVGTIQVDARGFTTDSNSRNRAIKNRILDTNTHEYVTFVPGKITGIPASVAAGQTYTFQIAGNLTIRDVTREVTFDTTVTAVSATELQGKATTTIQYSDFGIQIPSVREVASVAPSVILEIDFVARPV